MRSVEDIEAEIEKRPAAEVRRLAEWLTEYQARLWDSQIVEEMGLNFKAMRNDTQVDFP
jgi:hypothetical protein